METIPIMPNTHDHNHNSSGAQEGGGFSFMNSLKGGAGSSVDSGADSIARFREGLSGPTSASPTTTAVGLRPQISTSMALKAQPMVRVTNSFTSTSNYYHQQEKQHQRRTASYRNAPKKFSPKNVRRQGPSEGGGGSKWSFPGLSPDSSMDSEDHSSAHTTVGDARGGERGISSLKTSSFDEYYSSSTPGYNDAFALLDGGKGKKYPNSTGSTAGTTPSPRNRNFFPSTPKNANSSSPTRGAVKVAPSLSPNSGQLHYLSQTARSPSSRGSVGSGSLKKQAPSPMYTDGSKLRASSEQLLSTPTGETKNLLAPQSPPNTPPNKILQQSMPPPPSGSKCNKPSPTKSPVAIEARSSEGNNEAAAQATVAGTVAAVARCTSPMRHVSPMSGASRMKTSVKHSLAKTWSRAKTGVGGQNSRTRAKGSGNYSDAVSKALQDQDSHDGIVREVDVIDKPKSGGTSRSQEGIEVVCGSGTPMKGIRHGSSKWRNRSPSPVRYLSSAIGNDNPSVNATCANAGNRESNNRGAGIHTDRASTASTPSFFGRGGTGIRNMSPGRMKKSLKMRLAMPGMAASPARQRPPQHLRGCTNDSPEKSPPPLYPSSSGTLSGKGDGSLEGEDDECIDPIMNSLAHTSMSFDVDEQGSTVGAPNMVPPEKTESVSPQQATIQENGMGEDGYYINTTSFNIFESHEFLRAMGGSASEASLATNYIRTGDSFCSARDSEPQFERAIQVYYAGLGVIMTRIKDGMSGSGDGSRIEPSLAPANQSHLEYNDFLKVAYSPETNFLLLAMSSILLRVGNARFRLGQHERACGDYTSAQSYRLLRHEAKDVVVEERSDYSDIHVEDAKLNGRISNNLASAQSKRGLYDEARSEYTKALQIKQGTLEALHRASSTTLEGGMKKEVDDKHLVSDIASTFHNIGLLRMECGEPKKAEKAYKQSLSLRVKKFGLDDLGVSSTLSALGDLYYHQKQYDEAFRSYKESLRIWKSHSGRRHDEVKAEHYFNIGLVFYSKGPLAKARSSATECLRIRRQLYRDGSLPVASALYLLGLITSSSGNYDEALRLLEESKKIRRSLLQSKDHLSLLNVELALGAVHQRRNNLDSAMDCFSVVLGGRIKCLGNGHLAVSEVLQVIGETYAVACEYDKAYVVLEDALNIRRASLGPSLEVAETLNSLGLVLFKSGDTEKAIELSEEALDVLKTFVGFDHLLVGKTLKNTGDYYQEAEAFDDAMEAYNESIRVMTAWYGSGHVFLSEVLNEIGVTRFKSGEYVTAKQSFTEALRLMRLNHNEANKSAIFPTLNHLGHALYKNNELKQAADAYIESFLLQQQLLQQQLNIQVSIVTGCANDGLKEFGIKLREIKDRIYAMGKEEDVSEISDSLGGIASILRYVGLVIQDQGDIEAALLANKLSLSVRLCQPFKEHSAIALMAETIAMFEYKRSNLESALDYFNQALEAKKSYQGESTIAIARTVNNLANIHVALGNLEDAMELYQEALEIKRLCLGDDSDEVANTLNNIAHVMVNAGKEQEALKAYHNVIKIRQDRYGKSHASIATTLASMGDVYIKLGKLEIAMTYFEQCIRIQKLRQDHCDVRVLENLGSIYGKLGEWSKAESTFLEITDLKRAAHGNECLDVAKALDLLAVSYIEQDRYADSIQHLQQALLIRKACLDKDDDEILASLNKLAFVYKSLDMTDRMLAMRQEFDAIQARRRDI